MTKKVQSGRSPRFKQAMRGHTNQAYSESIQMNTINKRPEITEAEFLEIENVMKRALQVEKKELNRISKLYQQFNGVNKPLGNGQTTCLICNCNFELRGIRVNYCNDCSKKCCNICSGETLSYNKKTLVRICKICAEYRDFLKKSGAWFRKRIPVVSPRHLEEPPPEPKFYSSSEFESSASSKSANGSGCLENDPTPCASSSIMSRHEEEFSSNKVKGTFLSCVSVPVSRSESVDSNFKEITPLNLVEQNTNRSSKIEISNQPRKSVFDLSNSMRLQLVASRNESSKKSLEKEPSTEVAPAVAQPTALYDSKLGWIHFSVEFIASAQRLNIHLTGATNLIPKDSNGLSDPYVKLHLLPGVAKATKLRSKTVYKNLNPKFNETLHYEGIVERDLDTKTLRLTVLDEDKFGFDYIGEYRLPLNTLLRNQINHFNVPLEEHKDCSDEDDASSRGKINFALKYSKVGKCLFVKINRCTQLLPMDNGKSSDPFVEIALTPASKEFKKMKTSVKWKTLDPEFVEEFKFTDVELKTLLTKTIEISVWDKDFAGKNDFIGMVKLGQKSTGEELKHFYNVIKNPEIYHEKWHILQPESNE